MTLLVRAARPVVEAPFAAEGLPTLSPQPVWQPAGCHAADLGLFPSHSCFVHPIHQRRALGRALVCWGTAGLALYWRCRDEERTKLRDGALLLETLS